MQPKRQPPSPQESPPDSAPSAQLAGGASDPGAAPSFTPGQPTSGALDSAAFTAIVARNRQDLYAFLRGLLGNDELAQDLTQDAFHDAWRAAQRGAPPFAATIAQATPNDVAPVDADDTAIRRWLFHAAYYKAISARRRWRLIRWESLDLSVGAAASLADPAAGAFDQRVVEGDALRTALARLTPQDAACLLLRVVQGFSASEVGAIVGASAETVTKRLSRARQRLRGAYLAVNDPGGDPHASAHENAHVNAHEANHGAYDLRPDAAPKEQARS